MKANAPPEQGRSPSNATPERDETQCSARQLARRRILKAAAGAPVVFVVNNGTATAASSSMCLENSDTLAGTSEPAPIVESLASDQDGWVRVAVEKLRYEKQGNASKVTYGYRLDGVWYRVSGENPNGDPEILNNWDLLPYSNNDQEYYYLLAEYPSGTAVPHTEIAQSPVAGGSCWNSMDGVGTAIHNLLV